MRIVTLNKYMREEIDEFINENQCIEVIERPSGIYNMLEWLMPSAIVVYLTKPFFEAFFTEAGKDAYDLFKSSLKKFVRKIKLKNEFCYCVTTNKQTETRKLDFYYKLGNVRLKFLLYNSLDADVQVVAVEKIIEFIKPDCEQDLIIKIEKFQKQNRFSQHEIFLEYHPEREQWEFIDVFERIMEQQRKARSVNS
ncbi:hypothetical protein EV210_103358 [Anaerospora hongkongensis]|uniref:Uncharacterized protein n=1 Tax=Anaerospora hongkongensis TaxID=244830 RepID=A0A4R1Q1N9_9FIRM|nr:hypothetical protein [Anaerospora hongkongensis]TCL38874.1 hypothetical protein EV210_103358 [Anaerospora hongkongensis]